MAAVTDKKIKNTYKDFLQVSNSNSGIDGTLRDVEDGEGTVGPFQISSTTLTVPSGKTIDVSAATKTGFPKFYSATRAITAADSQVAADDGKLILASAASADYAYSLLAAATAGDGFTFTIRKTDDTPYMITVTPNGSETIGGLPDLKLRWPGSAATFACDASGWHIVSHENVAIEYNAVENASFLVDQYSHITRTGAGASTVHMQDRWQVVAAGSASGRFTYSNESAGGVDGKSKWAKFLCTTADASPGAAEALYIRHTIIGNTLAGAGFLGSDGLFENGVLSMDIIGHQNSGSAPWTATIGIHTLDGTAREYIEDVTISADATWQRVSIVIPEDATADIDPGTGASFYISVGIYGGSSAQGTSGAWANNSNNASTSGSENWASEVNDYIGITNVKLQPGQIATPFVPRTYEEELAACIWYYERFQFGDGLQAATGHFADTDTLIATFEWSPKRTDSPSVSFSAVNDFQVRQETGSWTATDAMSMGNSGSRKGQLSASVAGTPYTAGLSGEVAGLTGSDNYIIINDEI